MAKKQTRRSISVSRTTYERLKAFCETNNISMSQLVETRVNDFLGPGDIAAGALAAIPSGAVAAPRPVAPRPAMSSGLPARPLEARPLDARTFEARPASSPAAPVASATSGAASSPATAPAHPAPMTSAAARYAVEPPLPIIKPRQDTAAPKPAEKRPEQIFTF